MSDALPRFALVACVAKKGKEAAPAKDLYVSPWFKGARTYVERRGLPWAILSAKHGLVMPDDVIAPYDERMDTKDWEGRWAWAISILVKIQDWPRHQIVMLAGETYRRPITPGLTGLGHEIVIPMEGLQLGEQLRWLKQQNQ